MKKLALALVCFASVAFMASCVKPVDNPEPSIAVTTGENYVYDGQTIDVNTDYKVGFRVASNSQTLKELSTFKMELKVFDLEGTETDSHDSTYNVTGTEYIYDGIINFELRELIGKVAITATVTDVDGKMNSTTLNLNLNEPAQPLTAVDFDWYRLGNTQTGLDEYGLYWERNAKSPFAQIKPIDGVTLYKFDASVWEATTTDVEKAALFSDSNFSVAVYNGVDVNAGATYDDVIGTRMADGTLHLLHVTRCTIGNQETQGRPIHIYGQAK